MTSIARKNLLEDVPRFLVAQVGILFAVSLVTIQTGLQAGFTRSTSRLIAQSRAHLWIADKGTAHLGLTLSFPHSNLKLVRDQPGVRAAEAILIRPAVWRKSGENTLTPVTLIGADPKGILFNPDRLTQGKYEDLATSFSLIVDEAGLGAVSIGTKGKINDTPATIQGFTQGTQSVVFENLVFASLRSANHFVQAPMGTTQTPIAPIGETTPISFILVQVDSNADSAKVQALLQSKLPDLQVFTSSEITALTESYWQVRSGIGFILGMGAVVGIVVGAVVVGQILYASVTDHLKEFGTLKAMGASDLFLYGIILEQALWMAILGYVPGMALCVGIASWTAATQSITILITLPSAVAILAVTIGMCMGSAVFAIQKVLRVDPVIVFKS